MQRRLTHFQEELILYFRARFTLLYVVTPEEERVLKQIVEACDAVGRPVLSWDIADGFIPLTTSAGRVDRPARDPLTALETILRIEGDMVFVFKDFHSLWEKNPQIIRKVKNVAQTLKQTKKTIIVTSHVARIPDELGDQVYVMDFDPPDYAEMRELLEPFLRLPNIRVTLTELGKESLSAVPWVSPPTRPSGSWPRRSSRKGAWMSRISIWSPGRKRPLSGRVAP